MLWYSRGLAAGIALACFANTAEGLRPTTAITQYGVDGWGAEPGFPGGPAYSISQTADDYLWIGAQNGLDRFAEGLPC